MLYSGLMMASTMDIEGTYQRGFGFRCEGRYAEAKAEFSKVLASSPGHIQSLHQLGLIQGFEGDFDGSMATLVGLAQKAPSNLDIKYDLAMTQMMLGMYEEACMLLKQILAADPSHEKALQQATYC